MWEEGSRASQLLGLREGGTRTPVSDSGKELGLLDPD